MIAKFKVWIYVTCYYVGGKTFNEKDFDANKLSRPMGSNPFNKLYW